MDEFEKAEAIRPLQTELLDSLLGRAMPETLRLLVVGLRLVAVAPTLESAQFTAWASLKRAWREQGLPEETFEELRKLVGYEFPPG